jgi:hypothetical protein
MLLRSSTTRCWQHSGDLLSLTARQWIQWSHVCHTSPFRDTMRVASPPTLVAARQHLRLRRQLCRACRGTRSTASHQRSAARNRRRPLLPGRALSEVAMASNRGPQSQRVTCRRSASSSSFILFSGIRPMSLTRRSVEIDLTCSACAFESTGNPDSPARIIS